MYDETALLINLENVVYRIMRRHLLSSVDNPPESLCQYTSFDNFRKMAPYRVDGSEKAICKDEVNEIGLDLWLMDGDAMNDPLEGLYLLERSRVADDRFKSSLGRIFVDEIDSVDVNDSYCNSVFVASLSSSPDNLDLWRLYPGGHGVCLTFSPSTHMPFYQVEYGHEACDSVLEELAWVLEPIEEQKSISLFSKARIIVWPLCFLFKATGHETDREFRLIESRPAWNMVQMLNSANDGKGINRLYVEYKRFFFSNHGVHDQVIVGPLSKPLEITRGDRAFLKEVKWRLTQLGLGHIPVRRSEHIIRY